LALRLGSGRLSGVEGRDTPRVVRGVYACLLGRQLGWRGWRAQPFTLLGSGFFVCPFESPPNSRHRAVCHTCRHPEKPKRSVIPQTPAAISIRGEIVKIRYVLTRKDKHRRKRP